ncbi:MAG TPA: hypothetical protein PK778_04880 [Bacillota bacterium]|nr:hypothetical protein [Clostridiales bacterium]HPT85309.1 hypothetical protein [Bacillota bacterium]
MMKKLLSAIVFMCLFASLMATGAVAENPTPTLLWEFGADSDIEQYMGGHGINAVTWEAEDFYHIFTATGNDPYVSIDLSVPDVNQIWWVKARVLNKSYATAIELFASTNGRSLTGPECTHIDIKPNYDEWQTVITYIPDSNVATVNAYKNVAPLTETYWEGTVDWIRLDPMWRAGDDGSDSGGNMEPGQQIYIDYIAFFPTKEEAEAYVGSAEAAAAAEQAADVPAAETEEVPAAEEPAETPPAPYTADLISLTFATVVFAAGVVYELTKKRK